MSGLTEEFPLPDDTSALIARARGGDREALGLLLEPWRRYLLAVAGADLEAVLRRRLGPSDIVQETYLAAVEAFAAFQGQTAGELRAWLSAIQRNNQRQAARHNQADRRDIRRDQPLPAAPGAAGPTDWRNGTPSGQLGAREEEARLAQAVAGLAEDEQLLLRLVFTERLSWEEVAGRLPDQPTANAARMRCARLVLQLREKLGSA